MARPLHMCALIMRLTTIALAASLLTSLPIAATANPLDAAPSLTAPSLAAPTDGAVPRPAPTREVSYASRTLALDGVAAGLLGAAFAVSAIEDTGWGAVGLVLTGQTVYGLGAPLVHFSHGRYKAGLQSLGLRAGLPFLAGLIGGKLGPGSFECADGSRGSCDLAGYSPSGVVVGAGIGLIAASVLDARFLARKRVVERRTIAPSLGYHAGRVSIGLGGSF